jgi:hypothetical protein
MISAQMTNRPLPILRYSFLFDSLDLINQVIGHACVPRRVRPCGGGPCWGTCAAAVPIATEKHTAITLRKTFHCNPQSSLRAVILRLADQNRNTRIAEFFQWNEFRRFVN